MADHELDSVTIRKLLSTRHFKSISCHRMAKGKVTIKRSICWNLLQQYQQHHGQSPPTLFADCTTAAMKNEIHDILMNILKDNII